MLRSATAPAPSSPTGDLAYRLGSAPESARLALVRLSDFREWPIASLEAVSS